MVDILVVNGVKVNQLLSGDWVWDNFVRGKLVKSVKHMHGQCLVVYIKKKQSFGCWWLFPIYNKQLSRISSYLSKVGDVWRYNLIQPIMKEITPAGGKIQTTVRNGNVFTITIFNKRKEDTNKREIQTKISDSDKNKIDYGACAELHNRNGNTLAMEHTDKIARQLTLHRGRSLIRSPLRAPRLCQTPWK